MGSFSFWHLVIALIIFLPNLVFVPAVKKAGFSPWWVAVSLIPIVGFILLWIFAYAEWPAYPNKRKDPLSDSSQTVEIENIPSKNKQIIIVLLIALSVLSLIFWLLSYANENIPTMVSSPSTVINPSQMLSQKNTLNYDFDEALKEKYSATEVLDYLVKEKATVKLDGRNLNDSVKNLRTQGFTDPDILDYIKVSSSTFDTKLPICENVYEQFLSDPPKCRPE